jgi:hypothetical protein
VPRSAVRFRAVLDGTPREIRFGVPRLALTLVLLFSSIAAAQAPGDVVPTSAPPDPVEELKSPTTAVGLSIGFTLGGLVLAGTAGSSAGGAGALGAVGLLYLGPSAGRWYAGETGGGSLALRAVGGVAMVTGLMMVLSHDDEDCLDLSTAQCNAQGAQAQRDGDIGGGLMLGGAALWIGTTAYDIVMAGRDAESFNRRHSNMQLAPMMATAPSGHRTVGLSLEARF